MEGTKKDRLTGRETMREVLSEGDCYIRLAHRRIHPLEGKEQEKTLKDRVTGTRPDRTRRAMNRAVLSYYIQLTRRRIDPLEAEE